MKVCPIEAEMFPKTYFSVLMVFDCENFLKYSCIHIIDKNARILSNLAQLGAHKWEWLFWSGKQQHGKKPTDWIVNVCLLYILSYWPHGSIDRVALPAALLWV